MQPLTVVGGGGGPQTGVYSTFVDTSQVVSAVNTYGWVGIGAVAGSGAITTSPWTKPYVYSGLTVDQIVEAAYSKGANFWWLDFWTVAGPSSNLDSDWLDAGEAAGKKAAYTIMQAANNGGGFLPAYVILDPEGDNTTNITESQFKNLAQGWVKGVTTQSSGKLTAAIYQDQYNWTAWKLNSLLDLGGNPIPGFVAVNPVATPSATGNHIVGYCAAYGSCPAAGDSVAGDVSTVNSWGALMNTLQLSNDSYDCYS